MKTIEHDNGSVEIHMDPEEWTWFQEWLERPARDSPKLKALLKSKSPWEEAA